MRFVNIQGWRVNAENVASASVSIDPQSRQVPKGGWLLRVLFGAGATTEFMYDSQDAARRDLAILTDDDD